MQFKNVRQVEWADVVEAIEQCYALGWTDGLPVVPPTVERVNTFLEYVRRAPDEVLGTLLAWIFHIPPNLVVEHVTAHRKPPEVRIWRLRSQSRVGTLPPSTSTPHWPACRARR